MRERDLDRLFVDACKLHGIVTYKTSSYGCRGFADRTLFGPGLLHGYVELKAPKKKQTIHQKQFEKRARAAGCFHRTLYASDDREVTRANVLRVIDDYLEQNDLDPDE